LTASKPPLAPPERAGRAPRSEPVDPFEASLEAIGSPAFLLRGAAEVVRANRLGLALLEREPDALGRPDARRIQVPGVQDHALVVLPELPADARTRAAAAAREWGLTARHRDVLALLATGASNGEIARALACSEKTVEAHVTAILDRSNAASRYELIARFWGGA
jgi:DNA-binding CsgD family transcriptional regulator